jgi:hypothetical protein
MEVAVNYWAVLLAAVASMVVGASWYAQSVFGKRWAKLAKVKMDKEMSGSQMAVMYGGTFLASLITAYVLAHVTYLSYDFFKYSFLETALTTAFWLWLGLTAARVYVHDTFEGRPVQLTALTAGFELVTLVVMALIIGLMGVQ